MRYIRWHYYHLAGSCIYVLAADSEFGLPIQYLYHCIKGSRRLIGERDPYRVNMTAVLEAAERTGTTMEINAHPSRLDLADVYVRKAKELGVKVAIGTDAHSSDGLDLMRFGVMVARRGWLEKDDVINAHEADTLPYKQ